MHSISCSCESVSKVPSGTCAPFVAPGSGELARSSRPGEGLLKGFAWLEEVLINIGPVVHKIWSSQFQLKFG